QRVHRLRPRRPRDRVGGEGGHLARGECPYRGEIAERHERAEVDRAGPEPGGFVTFGEGGWSHFEEQVGRAEEGRGIAYGNSTAVPVGGIGKSGRHPSAVLDRYLVPQLHQLLARLRHQGNTSLARVNFSGHSDSHSSSGKKRKRGIYRSPGRPVRGAPSLQGAAHSFGSLMPPK